MNLNYLDEAATERRWRAAAEMQGYKFFEVKLTRSSSHAVKVMGVVDLKHASSPATKAGEEESHKFWEDGGQAKFFYNEDRFGFYAKIYDDPNGYNRNFFASCYEDKEYEILDPEIKKDVEQRAKKYLENAKAELTEEQLAVEQKLAQEQKPVLPPPVTDIVAPTGDGKKVGGFKRKVTTA